MMCVSFHKKLFHDKMFFKSGFIETSKWCRQNFFENVSEGVSTYLNLRTFFHSSLVFIKLI